MGIGETAFSLLAKAVGIDEPYQWQWHAYRRLVLGDVPGSVVVPTAAGKTMLIVAFVAALATQAAAGQPVTLPRRLVHVVNRRILVDEATRLAQKLCRALEADPALRAVRDALQSLSSSGESLAVSALRGGLDDNGAWSLDPTTPAIVLATPDMLGSRLLFRGYGLGRSRAATHAGLFGCDTLIVHDEAHLAPAFSILLRQIEALARDGARMVERPPLQVVEMTATLHGSARLRPLVCNVEADARLQARMSATKRLSLVNVSATASGKAQGAVLESLVSHGLSYRESNKAVAMFVSSPALAAKLVRRLVKSGVAEDRVLLLTGTQRGYEREQLSQHAAFRRFESGQPRTQDGTAYFVATSAGEIGLDIDADVGIFDLTTIDRFIQRCGRVNRRGVGTGEISLVHAAAEELPAVLRCCSLAALGLLQELESHDGSRDVSPLALNFLQQQAGYAAAVEPPPATRMLEPQVVTMLSMTSLKLDAILCPAPDVFIHGLQAADAHIQLAWRQFPRVGVDYAEWMDAWPLAVGETARLPMEAGAKLLRALLFRQQERNDGTAPIALVLDHQGALVDTRDLYVGGHVARWVNQLRAGQTVLLNCCVGGLDSKGVPDEDALDTALDVSQEFLGASAQLPGAARAQWVLEAKLGQDGWRWFLLSDAESASASLPLATVEDALAALLPEKDVLFHDAPTHLAGTYWSGVVQVWSCDRITRPPDAGDTSSLGKGDRGLQQHLDLTAMAGADLARALGISPKLTLLLVRSGAEHDRGKQWARWQHAVGNRDLKQPLGKASGNRFNQRINDGYRHELGSLVDLAEALDWVQSHLIATHHGWGRPGFRDSALRKPGCFDAALNVSTGFDALNQTMGPWAVCYLEALVKSADVLAELRAEYLLPRLAQQTLPASATAWSPEPPAVSAATFRCNVDMSNFGEYLAALGLATVLHHCGVALTIGWTNEGLVLRGVDADGVRGALHVLCGATVRSDAAATLPAAADAAYPPLLLRFADGRQMPLNHWMDEGLRDASGWKLGAGQTSAVKTLESLLRSCRRALAHEDFSVPELMRFGGRKVQADASKFRFDAATNWSAQDAGFSLNEAEQFKSTRPWVELLSAVGLQYYFLPPADERKRYFVWQGQLTPTLALAAVKGLLPQCTHGFDPVIEPNGKMKDVFTSKPFQRERTLTCQTVIRVI